MGATLDAASHIVTTYYKDEPPFIGETKAFAVRKEFAREAANIITRTVQLLSPTPDHFRRAADRFYALCTRETPQAYAGFDDYVEAAIVLTPPPQTEIRHVVVAHHHLPYILHQSGWRGNPHVL